MAEQYLLAIDAGTGSIRAVLFSITGKEIAASSKEWSHSEDPRYPGSMNFDWVTNWGFAASCINEVIVKAAIHSNQIAAISTTCMREGIVLYDSEGMEIWACANVDARSSDEVKELKQLNKNLEKEIYVISGQTYALGALPRILWVKNKLPEVYKKIKFVSMFNDWLIYKMTGVLASEPSNGCTTGIFDLKARNWDTTIAKRVGLRDDIFPPVVECGTIVGTITQTCAKQTGLQEGTPCVTGGGDAQMGSIGCGVVEKNQAAIFGGTFWQYEFNIDTVKTDSQGRIRVNCHGIPAMWQYESIAFQSGLAMRWFRDVFCQDDFEKAKQQGKSPYALIDDCAAQIPVGSHSILCTFSDVMNYISWRHAAPTFTNFNFDSTKFTKYAFYRSIMENTALVTRGHIELVNEIEGKIPNEIIFANGASKSSLWCQILADVLNIPIKVPVVKEATALGAAILAGYGVGIYKNFTETAKKLVKWEKTYFPNLENTKIYTEIYEKWKKVYKAQLALSDKGITQYMWSAP